MIGFVFDRDEAARIFEDAVEEWRVAVQRQVDARKMAERLQERHSRIIDANVRLLGWPGLSRFRGEKVDKATGGKA